VKGAKYVARNGVRRPATLTKKKGKRGVAGGKSNVVDSRRRSEIAVVDYGGQVQNGLQGTQQ
jgi:hypothetical protein